MHDRRRPATARESESTRAYTRLKPGCSFCEMRTNVPGVHAVGDVVPTPQLAHVGFAEAIVAIKSIMGEPVKAIEYDKVPWGIYSHPEVAYAGLETGRRDRVSHVLEQGRIRLVLTGTLMGGDEIAAPHAHHGDGVHKIALSVPDAAAAYRHAIEHGARGVHVPHVAEDEHGSVWLASIATYGWTRRSICARGASTGGSAPAG